jgi:hypothetical protein
MGWAEDVTATGFKYCVSEVLQASGKTQNYHHATGAHDNNLKVNYIAFDSSEVGVTTATKKYAAGVSSKKGALACLDLDINPTADDIVLSSSIHYGSKGTHQPTALWGGAVTNGKMSFCSRETQKNDQKHWGQSIDAAAFKTGELAAKGAQGGQVEIALVKANAVCKSVTFGSAFTAAPAVIASVDYRAGGSADGVVFWVEEVSTTKFRACARALPDESGTGTVKLNWLAIKPTTSAAFLEVESKVWAMVTQCTAWTQPTVGATYISTAGSATSDNTLSPCTDCASKGDFYQSTACAAAADTVCTAATKCTDTQYESKARTATSNRECKDLTVCSASQYQSKAATRTTDRECKALTVCSASQYETTAAGASNDRTCDPLTVCKDGEYESTAPTSTSDRECSPVEPKPVDFNEEYIVKAASATSNIEVAPLTECTSTQFESTAPTETSDRVCTDWAPECVDGQTYETQAPGAKVNRVCAACSPCEDGFHQTSACTKLANRVCAEHSQECDTSTHWESQAANESQDRVCTTLTQCVAGVKYQSKAPTATSDRECSNCAPQCDGSKEYETQACAGAKNRVCTAHTQCSASQYCHTAGSAVSNSVCRDLTVCTGQQYESRAPSNICHEFNSNRVCSPITACSSSQYLSTPATATSDAVCTGVKNCADDEYQTAAPTATSDRQCSKIKECSSGQYQSVGPTATSDRQCAQCSTPSCSATQWLEPCMGSSNAQCSEASIIVPEYKRCASSSNWGGNAIGYSHGAGALNNPRAWSAKNNKVNEWWQMSTSRTITVVGVASQCRHDAPWNNQCITRWKTEVSANGSTFTSVDGGRLFQQRGSNGSSQISYQIFTTVQTGKSVKVKVDQWSHHASGRFAIIIPK